MKALRVVSIALVLLAVLAFSAFVAEDAKPKLDTGNTAWLLISTALVLLMTVPGLALFYGGLVRKKNILSTIGYSLGAAIIVTILWTVVQYSLAFSGDVGGIIGNLDKVFLKGASDPNALWGTTGIPESVFSMFQLMFISNDPSAPMAPRVRNPVR
jgi:Amt family ammonium transporter